MPWMGAPEYTPFTRGRLGSKVWVPLTSNATSELSLLYGSTSTVRRQSVPFRSTSQYSTVASTGPTFIVPLLSTRTSSTQLDGVVLMRSMPVPTALRFEVEYMIRDVMNAQLRLACDEQAPIESRRSWFNSVAAMTRWGEGRSVNVLPLRVIAAVGDAIDSRQS